MTRSDVLRARIVIVNYNSGDFISDAIESALAQTVPCEVLVADNASTDGSLDTIAARYPSVGIARMGENLGFGAAATRAALEEPRDYAYVAFLNPDAVARPQWIEKICNWMEAGRIDVASSIVAGDRTPFFAGGRWLPFAGSTIERGAYTGEKTDWISGCAMVVRREAFERLRGFDGSFFLYYEDVDLSLRARAAGLRLAVHPEALVAHPQHGRSTDQLGGLRKRCIGFASKGRLVRLHTPLIALPTALLFQSLVSPGLNGAKLREYPALVRAFWGGFRQHPARSPIS